MLGSGWELILFLIGFSALVVPGVLAVSCLFPQKGILERWVLGSAIGLAAAVYLGYVLAYINLVLFYPAWAIAAGFAFAAWLKRRSVLPLFEKPAENGWMLAVILSLVAASRFGISLFHNLPPGFDPSFHLIFAKKLATTGRIFFDWEPFENIALNYPLGSHFVVVIIAQIAHIPLHAVFKLLVPAIGVLSTAQIYILAKKLTARVEVAVFSALAYGLWAVYGSIDYYRWGGLPNLLGMSLFLSLLILLADERMSRVHTAILALLFVGIFFVHHHVMITSGLILSSLFAYYYLACREKEKHLSIFKALAGGGLLGCFYIVPYMGKALTIGSTNTLASGEVFFDWGLIVSSLGAVFLSASAAGIFIHFQARERTHALGMLYVAGSTLLILFVLTEYIMRWVAMELYGKDYAVFSPSRFLTDLVYFLSIFAGYAVFQFQRWLRIPAVWLFAICLALSITNYRTWIALSAPTLSAERFEAFQWIEKNTPPDTLVLNGDNWAAYSTWRRCMQTPVPVSEPNLENTRKKLVFEALKAGRILPEIAGSQVVGVMQANGQPTRWPVLWQHSSGLAVVEVYHGRKLLPAQR